MTHAHISLMKERSSNCCYYCYIIIIIIIIDFKKLEF